MKRRKEFSEEEIEAIIAYIKSHATITYKDDNGNMVTVKRDQLRK